MIVCAGLPSAPQELLRAMARRLPELGRPTLYCGDLSGEFAFLEEIPPESNGCLRLLIGGGPIPTTDKARVDLLPFSVHDTELLMASGRWAVDVCLLLVRPAERSARFCISPQLACLRTAARHARLVLAEVNEALPLLHGDTDIAADEINAWVTTTAGPPVLAPAPPAGATQQAIAAHVAGIVPDGACIQVGIGSLAEAILQRLGNHRDLALHSGFIGEGAARLMQAGVITGAGHPLSPGKVVTGALLGGASLFEYAHCNPLIEMRSFGHVNDPAVVASIPRFFAINSALSVDLLGQVSAEGAGGVIRAGGGGQMDFVPGAHRSSGGASVIALPSSAARGAVSRIVAPGALDGPVTCHRNWVDLVVTEWGVADLRGAGVLERAHRLIAIADPGHQAVLADSIGRVYG